MLGAVQHAGGVAQRERHERLSPVCLYTRAMSPSDEPRSVFSGSRRSLSSGWLPGLLGLLGLLLLVLVGVSLFRAGRESALASEEFVSHPSPYPYYVPGPEPQPKRRRDTLPAVDLRPGVWDLRPYGY